MGDTVDPSGQGRRLRVLHLLGPMEFGGAQTQLLGLLRVAHETMWDATVCATEGGEMSDAFQDAGVPYIELVRRGSPGLLRMAAVRRLVGHGGFDVVHALLPHNIAFGRVAVMGRRRRPALAAAERDVEPRGKLTRSLDRLLARWTDLWIANSVVVAERIRTLPGGAWVEVVTIPNAIDGASFSETPPPTPGPPWIVGTVARLSREKGIDALVTAVSRLVDAGAEIELRIAGTGPMEAELRARADGHCVRLVGPLAPGRHVADFLSELHLFVLPSLREGSPNALLEAVACGVPALATAIPAVEELALPLVGLTPPGDPRALSAGVEGALDRLARGDVSPRLARRGVLTFEEQAARYLNVFAGIARGRPG